MIVADGSALVVAVHDTTKRGDSARALLADGSVAPHLVDAEVGQGIRGLVLRGAVDAVAARRSLTAALQLVVERFAHSPLVGRAWELRDNVSFYDGLYVALAELLGMSLATADRKLAAANGVRCTVDVV